MVSIQDQGLEKVLSACSLNLPQVDKSTEVPPTLLRLHGKISCFALGLYLQIVTKLAAASPQDPTYGFWHN